MRRGGAAQRQAHRLTAFQVFLYIRDSIRSKSPTSVIRLGNSEGALLGYPTLTSRQDVDRSLLNWLRTKAVPEKDVLALVEWLKHAVSNADIVGLPRDKQIHQADYHLYRVAQESVDRFELLSPRTLETHAAVHRLLQHGLLYRPILQQDSRFLGIISCRPIANSLKELFNIHQVHWYGVRGAYEETGPIETTHYPDGFEELRRTLRVPFPGAVFLVGAGAFGKVYCQWIKERGGIAIDIGSMFDSWANIGRGRTVTRSLDVYRQMPSINKLDAIERYNRLADQFRLDVPRVDARTSYVQSLPAAW